MNPVAIPAAQEESPSAARDLVSRIRESTVYRDYEKAFQAITGLPLVLRAAGSFQAPMQGAKRINAFCALMAERNRTCAACLQLQAHLEESARDRAETSECFAGLQESAVPIKVGDKVIAFLQTGQVAFHTPTHAAFRRVAAKIGAIDQDAARQAELEQAYLKTRVIGKSQYESVVRMLEIFAQHLSGLANQVMVQQTHAEAPSIGRARAYIAEHFTEDLTLQDVARAVGMSTFYFCKTFSKSVGVTFTDYLSRVRVEAVKQMLLDPHKRVSEAAFAAGFQSLSQFNRVFSRVAGESPSEFRNELHGSTGDRRLPQAVVFAA